MGIFSKNKTSIEATTAFVKEGRLLIDECFTTKEEKLEANQKLMDTAFQDRLGARKMYVEDSSAQKMLSISIMVLWVLLTVAIFLLMYFIIKHGLVVPEWVHGLIGTAYGYINAKLGTVFDFFFGSSRSSQIKDVLKKQKKR